MNTPPSTDSSLKHNFAEDVRALMTATAHLTEEKVEFARKRLTDAFDSGLIIFGRVEDKAIASVKLTDKAVHSHPYKAIAIALGVGVFIGCVSSNRQ